MRNTSQNGKKTRHAVGFNPEHRARKTALKTTALSRPAGNLPFKNTFKLVN